MSAAPAAVRAPAAPATGFIPRPRTFWCGVALTAAGVAEHLWMFIRSAPMGFRLAGMDMGPQMWIAMAAIVIGVAVSFAGLLGGPRAPAAAAPPDGRQRARMVGLLTFALLVDQMKPATLAFIEPGIRDEYGLSRSQVAWLPTVALSGTVVGSLVWGRAADRIGRRATILLSALLFLGTTVCGAMPTFGGTLVMCWWMGIAAGGMLPVAYALMTEVLPARSRAVTMVLQAGLTTTGGYMAASGLAAVLIPLAGWRLLWFAQLPLVLVLIALNHWIPESAAFTAGRGKRAGAIELLRHPHRGRTLVLSCYALAWGLIYWGFVTFLPALLADSRQGGPSAATLLFTASLLAIPACAAAAWLYGHWSARGALVLYAAFTVAALAALAALGTSGGGFVTLAAVMALLAGCSGVVALVGPYTAERYPTALRGTAGGWVAAVGKSGGAFGPPLIAVALSGCGLRLTALLTAVPMAAAGLAMALRGGGSRASLYHGRMSFLRRRSAATPTGPDFDVLAMDPGDWPGDLGAGLLPGPDGRCEGIYLRYDLFGGRGPAMLIGNLPEGSPARELDEGQVPFEVAQLLAALGNDEPAEVTETEDTPVWQGDGLLIVRRIKISESRVACAQFDRSDGVQVTIATWDRPITDDLYQLLKPLPAEMFQAG